ncbi:MAG TPA: FG-GAP-like repeat-containing protein [Verrucomicrobiae bacterium]
MKTTKNSLTTVSSTICTLVTVSLTLLYLRASAAHFADVTAAAGVTNAPGYSIAAGWGDYDNDLDIDLYLAIGFTTPTTNAFFRNNGNGTFTRVGSTAGPITTDYHPSHGCAWLDFNNDGYRDLLVLNLSTTGTRNALYWNNGDGTFRSGMAGDLTQRSQFRSWSAAADYDRDGWVDIYVTEADSYSSAPCSRRLYHASPHGTFTSTNLGPTVAYANDAVWGDYDNDGDPDLFICGYTSASTLWRNDGGGNFTPVANGLPSNAQTVHAAWADYDRDGDLDIALSSFSQTRLYLNDGIDGFALVAILNAGAGATWADYDNDGNLDLLIVGGQDTPSKPGLFHNNGDGSFSRAVDVFTEVADNSLACPWGDYDNDGFMDVILTHQYDQHRLYRNLGKTVGNTNHWVKFKLVGAASNRDAIGAKVRIQATIAGQSVWQMQEVNGGYAMQNDTRLNFGLGDATVVDKVRIEWPSGNVNEYSPVQPDRIVTLTEQVFVAPARPTDSLGGSITLTSLRVGTRQWYHEGVALDGQTNATLNLANIQLADGGRYSVVATSGDTSYTNFVYLFVDTTFTKINAGSIVTDQEGSISGAWGDYNGDGYLDLYVANSSFSTDVRNSLYRNNGDGSFTKMTTNAFLATLGTGADAAWADMDNDGDVDLVVPRVFSGPNEILFNQGGGVFTSYRFAETGQFQSPALADIDGDGWLDIFFSNWSGQNLVYRNQGNGTYRRLAASEVGDIATYSGTSYVPSWGDYNNDGDADLLVGTVNGTFLYRNDGRGKFARVLLGSLATDTGGFIVQWVDYDNDGWLDASVVGITRRIALHRNLGGTNFVNVASTAGLGYTTESYGSAWGDWDNDGNVDLFVVNEYNRTNTFYRNNGDGTFSALDIGSPVHDGNRDCGVNWVDYDNDGHLDLFIACGDASPEPNLLYHNNGNSNSWLKVRLIGQASNRSGVGAKIRATARIFGRDVRQTQQVAAGGFGTDNGVIPHFGLGDAINVPLLRIEWPSGIFEEFTNVAPKQILTIVEPSLKGHLGTDGKFHVAMTMSTNRVYQLQATTDFVNWTVLTNCTGSGSCEPIEYVDPAAPAVGSSRYYRMK